MTAVLLVLSLVPYIFSAFLISKGIPVADIDSMDNQGMKDLEKKISSEIEKKRKVS